MSSQFTEADIQRAKLALSELTDAGLDIVVGGLGLGYTAVAALENPSVRSLIVVEVMAPVIDWHRRIPEPTAKSLARVAAERGMAIGHQVPVGTPVLSGSVNLVCP